MNVPTNQAALLRNTLGGIMTPKGDALEMTRDLLIGVAMLWPAALWSQQAARPEFEVASVKPNLSGDGMSRWDPVHGNFTAENASLKQLIGFAYHLPTLMISGPGWMESARFDIDAKGKADVPDSQVALMVQALLEDRFHLRAHRETKDGAVYLLEVASGGLKAPRADAPPTPYPQLPPGPHAMMQMAHTTMAELAANLVNFARPAGAGPDRNRGDVPREGVVRQQSGKRRARRVHRVTRASGVETGERQRPGGNAGGRPGG